MLDDRTFRRLAAGVLVQAYRDLRDKGKEDAVRLDALFWLAGPDAEVYCEVLGIGADPLAPVCLGGELRQRGRKPQDENDKYN